MEIREYTPEDAAHIAQLSNDFQDHLVALDPEKQLRRTSEYGAWSLERKVQRSQNQKSGFYVATEEDLIVGFVFGSIDPTPPEIASYSSVVVKSGTVEELYVDPSQRRKGVGSALMNKIEEFFIDQGCEKVNLSFFAFNESAQKLYEHLGYEKRAVYSTKKLGKPQD